MLKSIHRLSELCDSLVFLSNENPPAGLSRDALVDYIRSSTKKLKILTRETNELFSDKIDPMLGDSHTLTDEEDNAFFALAQKLSSFDVRIDTGMALKIYQALLNRARILDNRALQLKYLYWCGITLYYNNSNRGNEILAYFEEGAQYYTEYLDMTDRMMRTYVHRCLGNCVMILFMQNNTDEAHRSFMRTVNFWNKLMFLGVDLDLPWTSYFLSCFNHYRSYYTRKMHSNEGLTTLTRDEIKSIFKISLTMSKLSQKDAVMGKLSGGTRYDLMLWESQFVSGQINMSIFRDNIKNAQSIYAEGDYSANALHANIMLPCYLMFYLTYLLPDDEAAKAVVREHLSYVTNYVKALPADIDPGQLSSYISLFSSSTSGLLPNDEHFPLVVNLTTHRHKPTFAHTIVVSKLAGRIVSEYVLHHPGHFVGILGIQTPDEALQRRSELVQLAEKCGLCHDVGKLSFARNQTMYARALTEDEIYIVRDHVKEGLTYFKEDESTEEMNAFRSVIEGHHVFYDGSGGYPEDFDIKASPYRALIHTITVADSIAAATDDIGKVYAEPKSPDEVYDEIKASSGTRYSPFVAELLSDSALRCEIQQILDRDRIDAYYEAYRFTSSESQTGSDADERRGHKNE